MGGIKKLSRRLQGLYTPLLRAAALGLVLLALPTAFTVFPELATLSRWWRLLLVAAWAGLVLYLGIREARVGSLLAEYLGAKHAMRNARRAAAGSRSINLLLSADLDPPLDDCFLCVYLPDPLSGDLVSSYSSGVGVDLRWKIGSGATGQCFKHNRTIQVTGDAVWDTTYGLTPEQSEKCKDLVAVFSYPLRDHRNRTVGVLTASTESTESEILTPGGYGALSTLGEQVSCILVDVLDHPGVAEAM